MKTFLTIILSLIFIFDSQAQTVQLSDKVDSLFVLKNYFKTNTVEIALEETYIPTALERQLIHICYTAVNSLQMSAAIVDGMINKGTISKLFKKGFDIISVGLTGLSTFFAADNKKDNTLVSGGATLLLQIINQTWLNDLVEEATFINKAGENASLFHKMVDATVITAETLEKQPQFSNREEFINKVNELQNNVNNINKKLLEIYEILPKSYKSDDSYWSNVEKTITKPSFLFNVYAK